jgi:hypothetical protein
VEAKMCFLIDFDFDINLVSVMFQQRTVNSMKWDATGKLSRIAAPAQRPAGWKIGRAFLIKFRG